MPLSESDTPVSTLLYSSKALSSSSTAVTSPVSTTVDTSSPFPALATESNGTLFTTATEPGTVPSLNPNIGVDPQILEALENKERGYVLNLGEEFEALIKDGKLWSRVAVPHQTSYQRLLIHRCSAYYKLQPEIDPSNKALYVILTSESRIPERRVCELVPAESPTRPGLDPRTKPQSHTGLVAGDGINLLRMLGDQSYNTNSSTMKRMTTEEREAAYNNAPRFGSKRKWKQKETHATSLTNTFHQDPMRKTGEFPTSGLLAFHGNSFGNTSQNSGATSPFFSYPTLLERTSYDASNAANLGYNPSQYVYPSPYPPIQGPNPSYLTPYTYDMKPYSMPQRNPSDSSPTGPNRFIPPRDRNRRPPAIQSPIPHGMQPHHQDPINLIGPPLPFHSPPYIPYSVNPSHLTGPLWQQPPQKRGVAPSASSLPWSFVPGIAIGGDEFDEMIQMNESIGPRFRGLDVPTSHNTSSGGSSGVVLSSRHGDDVSSTASSSTNSSQRTYYMSTTSSLPSSRPLPLPPRAAGLQAQPTLVDRQQSNTRDKSPISPSKSNDKDSPHSDGNWEENNGRSSVDMTKPDC